jgi:hypothetical protein
MRGNVSRLSGLLTWAGKLFSVSKWRLRRIHHRAMKKGVLTYKDLEAIDNDREQRESSRR